MQSSHVPHTTWPINKQIKLINKQISHVDLAHGYFAYVNKISFAYPEHLVHEGVALIQDIVKVFTSTKFLYSR